MINRWFCVNEVTYNLAAFTHFVCLARSSGKYLIRGYLAVTTTKSGTPSSQEAIAITTCDNKDEGKAIIADILAGEYDVPVKMSRIAVYDPKSQTR